MAVQENYDYDQCQTLLIEESKKGFENLSSEEKQGLKSL
jgi:hypothetical protein